MNSELEKTKGFTLVELMITVAIVAILAAIAYPSYQRYVVESKRAAAGACLMEHAHFMERFYADNFRYDQTGAGAAVALPGLQCANDLNGDYNFVLGAVAQQTFTVQAVPQGVQASADTRCATLTLDQAGQKSQTGAGTLDECWR